MRLSHQAFCTLVERALTDLPPQFERHLEDVAIDVEDQPDRKTLRHLELADPRGLLGLYQGRPLTERSVEHPVPWPERIVIYRRNVLRVCRTREEIIEQVRRTVLHELGHHFGLDEHDLDQMGYA